MAKFNERLRALREEKGLSQADLGKLVGLSKSSINMYERGEREPSMETLEGIADIFNVDMNYLHCKTDVKNQYQEDLKRSSLPSDAIEYIPTGRVPILGRIPAGAPIMETEYIEGYEAVDVSHPENYYYLRVQGDSMVGAGIQSGDLVLIKIQSCAENGQIVACRVNGDEATLKRFRRVGDMVILSPENDAYEPILVPVSEFDTGYAAILGIMVELKRKFI